MPAGGLSLRKTCGETVCPEYSVCLDHDFQCYPCLSYCNETSNNFDVRICEQQCQDYIHDYVRHYVRTDNIRDALQELESLKSWIVFMSFLVAIALIFISVTLAFIWSRERRIRKIKHGSQDSFFKKKLASLQYLKKLDKVKTVSETISNQNTMTPTAVTSLAATQTDLMAACTTPPPQSSSSSSASGQRTNTSSAGNSSSCSSNKLPCEDATLEFSGYDNFALKVSPVLGKTTTMVATTDLLQQYTP